MASKKDRYGLNPRTLMVEIRESGNHTAGQLLAVMAGGLVFFLLFLWVNVTVPGLELPKTAILRRQNADWNIRADRLSGRMARSGDMLSMLEVRDDKIYRSVYGMDEIPREVRLSGLGDIGRHQNLEGTALKKLNGQLDVLEKRAYIQSKSFDDISLLQQSAGDLAAHIPAISPISTDRSTYRMSSPFGYRSDPLNGRRKRHTGMDFSCKVGNPIYVTGDGVVTKVAHERKGYGNHVIVDHGFGYRTRYAHMSRIDVQEGDRLTRGDFIGLSGRSGRVTGAHLHYEVLYRKDFVNPAYYMDLDLSPEDYKALVRRPEK